MKLLLWLILPPAPSANTDFVYPSLSPRGTSIQMISFLHCTKTIGLTLSSKKSLCKPLLIPEKKNQAKLSTDQCLSLLLLTRQKEEYPLLKAQMCLLVFGRSTVTQGHQLLTHTFHTIEHLEKTTTTSNNEKTNPLLSANLGNSSAQVIPFMGWFDSSRKWKQSTKH